MKQILNIVKQDFRNLRRVPLVALLLCGLAILPSLYAWFNIAASWDPYSQTGHIKIAVVNEDKGTEVDGKKINIGNELIENLKDNNQMGWTFVNREKAKNGVRNGDYYASVYINRSFSKDLTSVLSGDPITPKIRYEVNEKLNAIAPKMTSAGASALVDKISKNFLAEASKALFTEFNNIGIKLEEELPTIRKIEANIFELEKRFPQINEFGNKIVQLNEDWPNIRKQLNKVIELEGHLSQLNQGADQVLELEEKLPQINRLGDKVIELEKRVPDIQKAAEGVIELNQRFDEISGELTAALEGVQRAQDIINRVQGAIPAVNNVSANAQEYVSRLNEFLSANEGAIDPIINVIIQNTIIIQHTADSIDAALQQVNNDQMDKTVLDSLYAANEQLKINIKLINQAIAMFTKLNDGLSSHGLDPVIANLTEARQRMGNLQQNLQSAINKAESGEKLPGDTIASLREQAQAASAKAKALNSYLSGGGRETIKNSISKLQEAANRAGMDLAKMQAELPKIEGILKNAAEIANTGEEQLQKLMHKLPRIQERVNNLAEKIQTDLPQAISAIHKASKFIQEDWPGIEQRIHQAADFVRNDLPALEKEFSKMVKMLKENLPAVEQGLGEVADFVKTRLPGLEDTVGKTADRIRAFEHNNDLSELISLLKNDIQKESVFFAEPVKLIEDRIYPIPNYGSANTPFYTTLCLWVGALLLANLLKTDVHEKDMREDYKIYHIYLGRLILFLIIAFFQGLIVSLGDLFILGTYAANPAWFVIFTIAIGLIFMTIVYTIVSVFGNIGKAIAIIFMVLQLSGAGGTFPIQVAPPFFQAINPYLPFTYAINVLREAVGGIVPSVVWHSFICLGLFLLGALILGLFLKKPLSPWIHRTAEKSRSSHMME